MEIASLPLEGIRITGGTQPRTATNESAVAEYAEAIRAGTEFPPVVVFDDGAELWLADGFHRYHAHSAAGAGTINCDVRQGTKRDAILFSVGANAAHGLRRSNEDKRKAVKTLLGDAEWAAWSDNAIAKACGVSQPFVSSLRPVTSSVISEKPEEKTFTTKHGTQAVMNTANIGKTKPDFKSDLQTPEGGMGAAPAARVTPPVVSGGDVPPDVADAAPELSEVDQLRNELADVREQAALMAEEIQTYKAIAEGEAAAEIKRLQAVNKAQKSQLDDYMSRNQELKQKLKALERRSGVANA